MSEAPSTEPSTERTTGTRLYWAAMNADRDYSEACYQASGGKRNRWTLTPAEATLPAVKAAYDAKRRADAAWATYQRVAR